MTDTIFRYKTQRKERLPRQQGFVPSLSLLTALNRMLDSFSRLKCTVINRWN